MKKTLTINDEEITTLPDDIGEKTYLEELEIVCPNVFSLPESFRNLKNLRTLTISRCNLNVIPDYICDWTKLEKLEIRMGWSYMNDHFSDLKSIPSHIGNLKNLSALILKETDITKVPASLGNCPLTHLAIDGNFRTLPESFGNLTKLETLEIALSKSLTLPESFKNLNSLKRLFIGASILKNPEILAELPSLEDLTLFTDDIVLPKNFDCFSTLKNLCINAPDMKTLSGSIGNCKNLKRLHIESDKLTKLPDTICELKDLEEFHLDTFALRGLPADFGNLTKLNYIDFFSGSLAVLPKSMAKLKKIETLVFDFFNLKEIPDWLKKITCKDMDIQTKKEVKNVVYRTRQVKKTDPACYFDYYINMGWRYRYGILDTYSVKKIEDILISAPYYSDASEKEKDVFKDIMWGRSKKLNRKFKWTEENVKRAVKVSDEFIKALKDAYSKAKRMLDTFYKEEKDKFSFESKYSVKITLYPEILTDDTDRANGRWRFYEKIQSYINYDEGLHYFFWYDSAKKDDSEFLESIYIKQDLSWDIEGFGDKALKDHHICYAIHELYSHNEWAIEDILKINSICTEIMINCHGEKF